MESGSSEGVAVMHIPLMAASTTSRKKEDGGYLDKGGH